MRLRLLALILAAGTLSVGAAGSATATTADPAPSSDRVVATESVVIVDRDGRMPVVPFGRYWS